MDGGAADGVPRAPERRGVSTRGQRGRGDQLYV